MPDDLAELSKGLRASVEGMCDSVRVSISDSVFISTTFFGQFGFSLQASASFFHQSAR
jgi:hypothetical protein